MIQHETRLRVRYSEVDTMGFVYYGNYAAYYEVGRTELMRSLGSSYKAMEEQGCWMPVISMEIRYHYPAKYDDELRIVTRIIRFTPVRIVFGYELYNASNRLLNHGSTTLTFIDPSSSKPVKAPQWFTDLIYRANVEQSASKDVDFAKRNMQNIFEKLWQTYTLQNPEVQKIHNAFTAKGESVVNDHIAFRTFDDARINVEVLARPFLKAGFVEKGTYRFEEKKLFAKHYENPMDPLAPRVFISQLETGKFSSQLQKLISEWIDRIPVNELSSDALIYQGNPWGKPSYHNYEQLRKESEYAAWVYVYGFCANHFTVSVNHLNSFEGIYAVNAFLKENGFLMNESGGEVKGTPQELLEQSSTRAGIIEVDFQEGKFSIPSTYYEFARRYPDADGKIYSGFIAKSADKIFESTDYYRK